MAYRIPCHFTGHQVLLNQPLPRDTDDFHRVDKHSKHVSPLTYLVWLQLIIQFKIFKHVKTKDALIAMKSLTKSSDQTNQNSFQPVT